MHTKQEHQNSTLDYGVGLQNAQTNCGVNKEKNMALPISNIYEQIFTSNLIMIIILW